MNEHHFIFFQALDTLSLSLYFAVLVVKTLLLQLDLKAFFDLAKHSF
jgi:hypothetical protein